MEDLPVLKNRYPPYNTLLYMQIKIESDTDSILQQLHTNPTKKIMMLVYVE